MNFGERTCTLRGCRRVTLASGNGSAAQDASEQGKADTVLKLLSAMQLERAVRAGCESFIMSISKVDEVQTGGLQNSGNTGAGGVEPLQGFLDAHREVFPE